MARDAVLLRHAEVAMRFAQALSDSGQSEYVFTVTSYTENNFGRTSDSRDRVGSPASGARPVRAVRGAPPPCALAFRRRPSTRSINDCPDTSSTASSIIARVLGFRTNSGRLASIRVLSDAARIRVPAAPRPSGGGSVRLLAHLRGRRRARPRPARCRPERADGSPPGAAAQRGATVGDCFARARRLDRALHGDGAGLPLDEAPERARGVSGAGLAR